MEKLFRTLVTLFPQLYYILFLKHCFIFVDPGGLEAAEQVAQVRGCTQPCYEQPSSPPKPAGTLAAPILITNSLPALQNQQVR